MTESFESRIRGLQDRLAELTVRLSDPGTDPEELAKDALAELALSLEELAVAGEEIATQTDALIADQAQSEIDRQYYEGLFVSGPAAYVITDKAAKILTANQSASDLFGVDPPFLRGKPLSVFLGPDSQLSMFRLLDEAVQASDEAPRADLTIRSRSGQVSPITAVVTQAPGAEEGEVEYRWLLDQGIAGRDFEALTPVEQDIATAALRLDSIVESASDAIVAIDQQQRIILFNRAAVEMFGRSAAEMLGRPLTSILPTHVRDRHEDLVSGFAEEESVSRPMGSRPTLRATKRDGSEFPAEITVSKVRVDHHWVFTAIIRDVSEREAAVEELHAVEQQLLMTQRVEIMGQLGGSIAHDLNNLLSIVQGHVELLGDELPPAALDRVESIASALKRAQALIANLTAIGRADQTPAALVGLNESTIALGRILADILGPDVTLELELNASPDLVRIDPTRVEQVLLNLVLNACDAMPAGGRVTIATRFEAADSGPRVWLTVTDTGEGMAPEVRRRALEPFFTTKGPQTGTGMGLASTRLIVESAGGDVAVTSEPGVGTTIAMWFPAGRLTTSDDKIAPVESARNRSATILVVDDELGLLEIVRDMLEGAGHHVLLATSAQTALAVADARGGDLDLVVTDVRMPGGDGHALAEDLWERFPDLEVIFMTAHADLRRQGPQAVTRPRRILRKPFSRNALLREVAAALEV